MPSNKPINSTFKYLSTALAPFSWFKSSPLIAAGAVGGLYKLYKYIYSSDSTNFNLVSGVDFSDESMIRMPSRQLLAAPTVVNPVADQLAIRGQAFSVKIEGNSIFSDLDGDTLSIKVRTYAKPSPPPDFVVVQSGNFSANHF